MIELKLRLLYTVHSNQLCMSCYTVYRKLFPCVTWYSYHSILDMRVKMIKKLLDRSITGFTNGEKLLLAIVSIPSFKFLD